MAPNRTAPPALVEDAVDGIAKELHHCVGGAPQSNLGHFTCETKMVQPV